MDEEHRQENDRSPSVSQLSKTPSWIMLGAALGALFVWMLPRAEKPAPPALAARPPAAARPQVALTTLTTIEAVFAAWGQFAVWQDDLTEVALWNSTTDSFSEFYEVKRSGDALYFRSLSRLTRLPIRHGKPPPAECPLQFTETVEQYREWQQHGRTERPLEAASNATGEVKFRGMQVFEISKLEQIPKPRPAKAEPPPAPKIEPPPVEVPPKP